MNNIHLMVVNSRWGLGREVIVTDSNSHELPCVALLSGPVQGPTSTKDYLAREDY